MSTISYQEDHSINAISIEVDRMEIARKYEKSGRLSSFLNYWFSTDEQKALEFFMFNKRKIDWMSGRIASKIAISKRLNQSIKPHDIAIQTTAQGQPLFESYYLSISHDSSNACATIGDTHVGVDIEQINRFSKNIYSDVIFSNEVSQLQETMNEDPIPIKARLWCLKEALFKATNPRLSTNMPFFRFASLLIVEHWRSNDVKWQFNSNQNDNALLDCNKWLVHGTFNHHRMKVIVKSK